VTQVFLSYSTLDAEFVEQLAADLRAAGIVVWKAPDNILPGEEWVDAIQRGLITSSHLLLVKSPNAVKSKWVKFEFNRALARFQDDRMMIIPIHYDVCDAPDFWLGFQDVNLRDNYTRGMMELIKRLNTESPENPPMPTIPETTVINVNIAGDVSGVINVAGRDVLQSGADAGRPPLPHIDTIQAKTTLPDFQPPDLSHILPAPFTWCEIPAGKTKLENNFKIYNVGAFYLAKYPITYAQFQGFIDQEDGYYNNRWWKEIFFNDQHPHAPCEPQWDISNYPRERVRWADAIAFTRWLSVLTSADIRLPKEWEWQWAAQGIDGRQYPWGNEFDTKRCNTEESGLGHPTPVNYYPEGESPFHVLDMCGNLWEWCLNDLGNIRTESGFKGTFFRAMRGGSWHNDKESARITSHTHNIPFFCNLNIGFRIACFPPSQ
jgi:hypothetical protein